MRQDVHDQGELPRIRVAPAHPKLVHVEGGGAADAARVQLPPAAFPLEVHRSPAASASATRIQAAFRWAAFPHVVEL